MPELPEIETVKLQLQKVLLGQRCIKYQELGIKEKLDGILNKKVTGINRKGKVLLIEFGPGLSLGFHFKMTGQLIYEPHPSPLLTSGEGRRIVGGHPTEDFVSKMPSKHTRAIFEFDKGTLYFNDQRVFGWIMLNPKFVDKLGPEPFAISAGQFVGRIGKIKRPIKVVIMDQEIISGVGNIYANDALWESRIHPATPVSQMSVAQLDSLLKKIQLVLREGIKYGGATAENYVNLHGLGGHYQDHFRTYNREGLPCLRCKTKIKKIVLGGRGTYYCPKCQT